MKLTRALLSMNQSDYAIYDLVYCVNVYAVVVCANDAVAECLILI